MTTPLRLIVALSAAAVLWSAARQVIAATEVATVAPVDRGPAQTLGLRIVVIEGENAVNIIQQKTAVSPIVEVRDRNDLPVPGVAVSFTISGGKVAAFAGGSPAVTVTTNAAGRATATAITPIGKGAVQIQVSAAFQGQTAAATIAQTNVMTAAEAAAAGASGGGASSAGAAGASGGGGGGLSGTTLGIIGAAAGGGTLVATKVKSSGPSGVTSTTVSGPFSGPLVLMQTSGSLTCAYTFAISGTLTMTLEPRADGSLSGTAMARVVQLVADVTGAPGCTSFPLNSTTPFDWNLPVTGTTGNLVFSGQTSNTGPTPGGTFTAINTLTFSGALAGGVVSGAMTFSETGQGNAGSSAITQSGSTTFQVTLR